MESYSFRVDLPRWLVVLGLFRNRKEAAVAVKKSQVQVEGSVVKTLDPNLKVYLNISVPFMVKIDGRNPVIFGGLGGEIIDGVLTFSPLQSADFIV